MSTTLDVAIIGGGVSGLYCAYKLLKNNAQNIAVFEQKGRLGGRIKSIDISKELTYDSGAFRIGKRHKYALKLIKELALSADLVPFNPKKKYLVKGKTSHANTELEKAVNIIQRYRKATKISNTFPGLCEIVADKPGLAQTSIVKLGYDAEANVMNCHDFLKSVDGFDETFYRMENGLSQIIKALVAHLGSVVKVKHRLANISYKRGLFELTINNKLYKARTVILATPKASLVNIPYMQKYSSLLESVTSNCYIRVYAVYPKSKGGKVWFHNIDQVTTDLVLRKVIPIDKDKGLIEVSYCDDRGARVLNNANIKGHLQDVVHKNLLRIFPEKNIPKPKYFRAHFWDAGTHSWLPHVDSDTISQKVLQPDDRKKLYVVGESYSQHQGWIEGALSTCQHLFKVMDKSKPDTNYFSPAQIRKHNTEKDAWVSYKGKVYDITQWISKHPGGHVFSSVLGRDMGGVFEAVGHSSAAINILEKYYIGKVRYSGS
jgi:monoamine oxidase